VTLPLTSLQRAAIECLTDGMHAHADEAVGLAALICCVGVTTGQAQAQLVTAHLEAG
jgi:hypothetical protein